MADPASSQPLGGPQRPVSAVGGGAQRAAPAKSAAADQFKALLESLEQKAETLAEKSRAELRPEELAAAVDEARSSLEDVLALQDRLLEAFRHSQLQKPEGGPPKTGGTSGQGGL